MKNIAIIPARGGSKRIPRKNIKSFLDKPIIAYSIEAAISASVFDEVMVSTDDQEIADVAVAFGAKVPFFRTEKTSDDFATLADVLLEVLGLYKQCDRLFDNVCCLLPTAPMISGDIINSSYRSFRESGDDSLVPVVEFSYPVYRGLERSADGRISMLWPQYMSSRSQDMRKVYHDSGMFYWVRENALIEQKTLFCNRCGSLVLSEMDVQDIDSETDWKLAELKYRLFHRE